MRLFILSLFFITAKGLFQQKECKIEITYGNGLKTVSDEILNKANDSDEEFKTVADKILNEVNNKKILTFWLETNINTLSSCNNHDKILKYTNQLLFMKPPCGYERWDSDTHINTYKATYLNTDIKLTFERKIKDEVC